MTNKIDIQALYNQIRTRIYTLEYSPGEALREEELASEFGVSRTPIRHVLQNLEFEGLVTSTPGVGSIVSTIDLRSLKEVFAFRLKLAEMVGDLSSPRIQESDIKNLEGLLQEVKEMLPNYDPKALSLLYLRFHEQMMSFITNRPLRKVYDQLFHQTNRVWLQILPELNWEDEVQATYEEIRDVINAVRANDINAMASVRRKNLALHLLRMNRYLGSANDADFRENRSG